MILGLENARICYEQLIKQVKNKSGKLIIFVGFDIDSLCSLRILLSLLRSDNVVYEVIPVMNYEQLDSIIENMKTFALDKNDIKGFVMINCGGTRDLSKYWIYDENFNIITLVVDVHRPIHHNNVNSKRNIILINDGFYNLGECPNEDDLKELGNVEEMSEDEFYDDELEDFEEDDGEVLYDGGRKEGELEDEDEQVGQDGDRDNELEDVIEEEEEDKEDSDEGSGMFKMPKDDNEKNNDNGDEENNSQKKRNLKRLKKGVVDLDSNNDHNDDNNNDIKIQKTKQNALRDEKLIKRVVKQRKIKKFENYYSGNFFGYPSSYIFYHIAQQMNKEDSQSLWLLIIATTYHYLQAHLQTIEYDTLYAECYREVLRLSLNSSESSRETNSSALQRINLDSENNKEEVELKVKTIHKDYRSIFQESDYKLFLYRHWNLYESFIYSSYTSANLMTWKEQGKKEIQRIFAYIGIPLNESKQKYTFMKNEHKSHLKSKIVTAVSKFAMKDLIFNSFVYQFNQRIQISASDVVNTLNAILDFPFNIKTGLGEEDFNDLLGCASTASTSEEDSNININNERDKSKTHRAENFWTSYEFLAFKNEQMLLKAFDLAIEHQKKLVSLGTTIIEKRAISSTRYFKYSIIGEEYSSDAKYFLNALSLEKLALFIMDTYHLFHTSKAITEKPFVLALHNNENNNYLIAGVIGNIKTDDERNQFPMRFRVAANRVGAKMIYNCFNDCIIEIPKDDFLAFLEKIIEN